MSNVIISPYSFGAPKEIINFDMSTSANWTFTGTTCSINTTSEYLEGSSTVNDDRGNSEIQSGFTLSDTLWIIRQKFDITAQSGTSGNVGQLYFGYTDKDNTTGVIGTRDGIGIVVRNGAITDMLQGYANNQAWQGFALSTSPSVTTYYLELKRNSATSITLTLYSNSAFTTVVETKTSTISADITGLKYIMIGGWDNGASGVSTVRVSDIVIYDNYSSVP